MEDSEDSGPGGLVQSLDHRSRIVDPLILATQSDLHRSLLSTKCEELPATPIRIRLVREHCASCYSTYIPI